MESSVTSIGIPDGWAPLGLKVILSIVGLFVFRATIFEPFWEFTFRVMSVVAGDSGFITDINLLFADFSHARDDIWLGYIIPFFIVYSIVSYIMKE